MWLDLEEGILEEFSGRASTAFDSLGFEFATKFVHTIVRVGTRSPSGCSDECAVCGEQVRRNASTCSRRCTQIRKRNSRKEAGVCTECGRNKPKPNALACALCAPNIDREERMSRCTTAKCRRLECANHVIVGSSRMIAYCSDTCRKTHLSRVKREHARKENNEPTVGNRVLVTSCSSDDPETRSARVLFIGKRGRVVGNGGMLTVAFYGNNRKQFHASELLKLS